MIGGKTGRLAFAGLLRPEVFALMLLGLPSLVSAWIPFVELKFESNNGNKTPNSGSTNDSAVVSATTPAYVTNVAISGGAKSLDFGSTNGNFYADITGSATLNAMKNLKSFTITGWVNCRLDNTNYGGGRIVSWFRDTTASGYGGVDLAFRSGGSLGLGVNQYNDQGGVTSSPGKISVDTGLSANNWRFFAVTFDGTVTSSNVKFYFGTNNVLASLDRSVTYNRTAVAGNIAPSLTIGNVPLHHRGNQFYSPFHGLIDQVRIYGSNSNNSGVLTLDQIQSLQQPMVLANLSGVLYDQWNSISGNALSALTSDPRYPGTPSLTKLQSNFEGYKNSGDNYGMRLSGWVKAPESGPYTFWIIADDAGQLRLSTDANPANKRLIASVNSYNLTDTSWSQFGSSQSEPVTLQAGQYYYLEALMKEGSGSDFVRVGWKLPSGTLERPIPQARIVTTPPDGVAFYPSIYPLYEPETYVKKAEMGWQKQTGDDHFYIKTDQTKALIAKNGMTFIPDRLNFGPSGLMGVRWTHDAERNFDYMALGTGVDGTPQFDALKVRRTPSGVDGVEFPMGLDFPVKEYVDAGSSWNQAGMADETGTNFYKIGMGPTSTTEEDGSLTSGRVGLNHTLTSTEIDHEFTQRYGAELVADALRLTDTHTQGDTPPVVSTGAMSALTTQFQTDEAGPTSTTRKLGSVSADNTSFTNTFTNTEVAHEFTLENASALDASEMRLTRTHTSGNAAPFITSSVVQAEQTRFTLSQETGLTSTTNREAAMSAQQVEVIETFNSTEIDHEYTEETKSTLDKGKLRIARTRSGPHEETTVSATLVDPDKIETGTVIAHSLVTTPKWRVPSHIPDYVFREGYELRTIEEVEAYARKHQHLPNFPSAKVMAEKGVDLTEMNLNLLRTVEELTLHLASLKKDMRRQQEEIEKLKGGRKPKNKGKAGVR